MLAIIISISVHTTACKLSEQRINETYGDIRTVNLNYNANQTV